MVNAKCRTRRYSAFNIRCSELKTFSPCPFTLKLPYTIKYPEALYVFLVAGV